MMPLIDPQRWDEIQAAFDAVVDLDPGERSARLAALGVSDPALHAALETLVAADAAGLPNLASINAAFFSAPTPARDPLNLAGRTVSHFHVLEPLGNGGMGVVYRAEDTRLGRAVALKLLLPHSSLDASAKARFLREAHAAAALDHPNLCTLYEVGESEDGRLFMAMALYSGETLMALLAREGPLPVSKALEIARQIAQGLGCAHAAGIVHRDLKPGNVMVLPDGRVKILDFGIARSSDESLSATGARLGTVPYMAPEQIEGRTADARADLWALGVVLYEMLTGQKPFAGDQELAIAHAILHAEPVAPGVVRTGIPGALEEIVLGLLQKEPSARYARTDDLLTDLAALGTVADKAVHGARQRRFLTTGRRPATWRSLVSLGAVLVIGGVAATAITAWLRPGPSQPMTVYAIPSTDADALATVPANRIAISRDGERVVYVGRSPGGNTQLWMRTRDQLHSSPLAGTEGAVAPFFSPDGSRLGFLTPRAGGGAALKVISLAGGTPTTVTDSAVDWGGGAWGYDGYIYFDGRLQGDGIARVSEKGGIPEPVTKSDPAREEAWHVQPEPLPNGKGVLFGISRGGDESEFDIGVVDLKTGAHRVLMRGLAPHYSASGHVVYTTVDGILMAAPFDQDKLALVGEAVAVADGVRLAGDGAADLVSSATGRLVYASGRSASHTIQLVWVTRDGKETLVDTTWRARFTTLALSPDGTQLAVGIQDRAKRNIWIKRLNRGPALKLTSEGDLNAGPAWTPDGRVVTFLSNSRSRSKLQLDLYRAMADGSALPQLLRHEAGSLGEAEYSRDGKWLLYRARWDLFAVRTDGDTTPIPLVMGQFRAATPRLSPDGRWLAYSSNESGQREVYVRPFPNTRTAKWQISQGGFSPVWSRDGRELFYINGRYELVTAPVLPGVTFSLGKQRVLLSVARYEMVWPQRNYDVSPDGSRFIMIRSPQKTRDELIVVENFFEGLKASGKR